MYWYFKYDRIFLLTNRYSIINRFYIKIILNKYYDISNLILFLNSLILGLLVFKNISEIIIIIISINNFIIQINYDINIILILI